MKKLVFILLSFISISSFAQVKVVQINSSWNKHNDLDLNLKNCQYEYYLLEDLSENLKQKIKSVPFIYVIEDYKVVRQYQAGLRMQLKITEKEIQAYINILNNN